MGYYLLIILTLVASPALAQGPCGGFFSSHYVAQPNPFPVHVYAGGDIEPVANGGTSSGSGGGDFLGGMNDGKAFLIVAVVAVAALPLLLYGFDAEAGEDLMHCWAAPTQQFQAYGGGLSWGGQAVGYLGGRGAFSMGILGVELSGESSPFAYYDVGGALQLRAPPRQHVELALSFGARQVADRLSRTTWLEVALPHRYLPFRTDAFHPGIGLELRPAVLFGTNLLDARLDASLVVPFGPWMTAALGFRAYSYAATIRLGAQLGFNLNL